MPDYQSSSAPSQVRYDKELRALYQERNARAGFRTPMSHLHAHRSWYLQLFVMLVVAVSVSLLTSLSVLNTLPPLVPLLPFERSSRSTPPSVELTDDLQHRLASAVVSFFPARTSGGSVTQPYLLQESAGQGLVLSSDGWLVTTQSVIAASTRIYQVASGSGHLYQSELQISDPVAPLTFIKTSATGLTATSFADFATLAVGQPVVVAVFSTQSAKPAFYVRRLSHLSARFVRASVDVPVSSEVLPDRYLLDQPLPAGSQGAPVTTLRGEVVGLVADYDGQLRAVVPLDSLGSTIDQLFAEHQVRRPSLGVTYVQSAWVAPFITSDAPAYGALVTGLKRTEAKPGSGLQVGDRILAVAGERLLERSFSSVLQQYRPGARLDLSLNRQGKEVTVNVTLGELVGKVIAAPKAGS